MVVLRRPSAAALSSLIATCQGLRVAPFADLGDLFARTLRETALHYLVVFYTQWRAPFFDFASGYGSPGPRALSLLFESRFTRLQCAGHRRFNFLGSPDGYKNPGRATNVNARRRICYTLPLVKPANLPGLILRGGPLPDESVEQLKFAKENNAGIPPMACRRHL